MTFLVSKKKMRELAREVLSKPPGERPLSEVITIEKWFETKSQYLKNLPRETLLDVIQHCDYVTRKKDDVIILQGEMGHRFFIILRGTVSVMLKDTQDDVVLGDEKLEPRHMPRESLGSVVVTLGEGNTFGEMALINPDCFRTASVIADERTDLVVIHRDLYNRSVSKLIAREYAEKQTFIDSLPFLRGWTQRMKRQLAVSLRKEVHTFDSVLTKQGDLVKELYFIVSGEVKLQVDPEAHYTEFRRFLDKCRALLDEDGDAGKSEKANFPKKLIPQLQKFSRMNKAAQLSYQGGNISPGAPAQGVSEVGRQVKLPTDWSPSAIRKMNQTMHSKRVSVNLSYLGERQLIGDAEMLLNLNFYHATAICSRQTVVMALHRNHFDRLFRKKAVSSNLRELTRGVEVQLTMRCLKHQIHESVPLLRCFLYKIQEMNGERRPGDEQRFMTHLRQLIAEAPNSGAIVSSLQESSLKSPRRGAATIGPVQTSNIRPPTRITNVAASMSGLESARQRTIYVPKIIG